MVAGNIAERLENLRKCLGLKQPGFAKLFGRGRKQASAWKHKRQTPPPAVLEWAAQQNGWPLAIFAEGGPMPSEIVNRPVNGSNEGEAGQIGENGPKVYSASGTSRARASDSATAEVYRPDPNAWSALEVLLEDALRENRTVTREEQLTWLRLLRRARGVTPVSEAPPIAPEQPPADGTDPTPPG